MATVPFDTLALAHKLEAAGFDTRQAQGTAAALAETFAGELVTNGGRVLGVTALAATLPQAAADAYAACAAIECTTKYYRRDIGARQLNRR